MDVKNSFNVPLNLKNTFNVIGLNNIFASFIIIVNIY